MKKKVSDQDIIALYVSGLGSRLIARQLGVTPAAIVNRVRTLGIKDETRGKKKIKAPVFCRKCKKELSGYNEKIFCSRTCSVSENNRKTPKRTKAILRKKICPTCGCEHTKAKFCSSMCYHVSTRLPVEIKKEKTRILQLVGCRRYQARKKKLYPPDANAEKIKEIYANCPDGYEVDHIKPLARGGLHHQDNLQYLPWLENKRKGDKLNWVCGAKEARLVYTEKVEIS